MFQIVIILQYRCFYCIFDQINAASVSIRGVFRKHYKILLTLNFWVVTLFVLFWSIDNVFAYAFPEKKIFWEFCGSFFTQKSQKFCN